MKKVFSVQKRFFGRLLTSVTAALLLTTATVWGAVLPPFGLEPLNQIAIQEPANLYQFVKNKPAAIQLGKALFWDMQAGSDGMTACATCHFSAGTDNRTKNTLNPGRDGIFDVRGVNQTVLPTDFPFHKRQAPVDFQFSLTVRDSDDVVGSQGVRLKQFVNIVLGSPYEVGTNIPDPLFTLNGVNTRAVTGRNTPSVINAAFNFTNFWDGRASAFFNGVNPFGPLDTSAGVWFNVNGTLVKQPVSIMFASLASQATGPPLNDVEMSFRGRTFPQLARKMLSLTPLGLQFVHPDDSELGADSRSILQPDGTLAGSKGLSISYSQMIKDAFHNDLWNSNQLTPDGFTQMESNFSLYWGLAIQLYEATLISDNTPFDRFLGGETTAMTDEQQEGMNIFFGAGRCDVCHAGSEQTNASHTAAGFINNASQLLMEVMPVASGKQILYDNGFNNTAVTKTNDDIGRAADSPFLNVLTGLFLPLSFSAQAELQAQVPSRLPFAAPILPANVPNNFPIANNGLFKVPGMRNIELTAPYMHNGSMLTLDEMIEFYTRGGNFPNANKADLDINIAEIPAIQGEPFVKAAMVAFMKAMTDPRVKSESAPFDHPEIFIPNGDSVNDTDIIHLQATGIAGIPVPVIVTVTPGFASPQAVGTTILFTANASGGSGAFEYQFLLTNSAGTVTVVRPFSAVNSWNWLTTETPGGTYTITVQARNATGTTSPTGFDAESSATFVLTSTVASGVSVTPNLPSPHTAGSAVLFTASGQGSTNYDYRFWLFDGTTWTLAQDYGNGATWTMPASTPVGIYTIAADVRTSPTVERDAVAYLSYEVTTGPATGVAITPSQPSPHIPGSAVDFTASGQGSANYDYRFQLFNGTSWTLVQNYGNGAVWTMPASTPVGSYTLAVDVRTSSAVIRDAVAYLSYDVTSGPATGVIITPSLPSPHTVGSAVGFTAAGQGSANYDYRFQLFNGTSWTLVQNYGNGAVWTMPASTPVGSYTIAVDVRTSSTVDRDTVAYFSYEVTSPPATGVAVAPSLPSPHPQGTASVDFVASGQGSANYDYRFWLFDGTSWTQVQGYGNGAIWTMPATTPVGDYIVGVDVRTSSTADRDAVTYVPYRVQ